MRFLLFCVFPLFELWLLIRLGALFGALTVVAMVVVSACIGVRVLQMAGWRTWFGSRSRLQRGESPAPELADGFLLAVSGLLLVLPGLISDLCGLLLLIGPLRHHLAARFGRHRVAPASGGTDGPVTIEGEYRRES